jgi:hypothetical protein
MLSLIIGQLGQREMGVREWGSYPLRKSRSKPCQKRDSAFRCVKPKSGKGFGRFPFHTRRWKPCCDWVDAPKGKDLMKPLYSNGSSTFCVMDSALGEGLG